jgi:hypothetical protein
MWYFFSSWPLHSGQCTCTRTLRKGDKLATKYCRPTASDDIWLPFFYLLLLHRVVKRTVMNSTRKICWQCESVWRWESQREASATAGDPTGPQLQGHSQAQGKPIQTKPSLASPCKPNPTKPSLQANQANLLILAIIARTSPTEPQSKQI